MVRNKGCFQPFIDKERCVNCGTCISVCPGLGMEYPDKPEPLEAIIGNVVASYNAWSKNDNLRFVSASGGVSLTLVETLLKRNIYDVAFCVTSYMYEQQLTSEPITAEDMNTSWQDSSLPKSRYLAVSHEKAVAYIIKNKEKRVILIGTACAIRGFRKVFKAFHLDPERYLLIGLFCDKVFNYNVNEYYQNRFGNGKRITAFHFKNKESGGWPGNMKFFYEDGSEEFQDKRERADIKDFFMPERCLYCIDKLNTQADLSIGDNYTDVGRSSLGSNSVLIRTAQGKKAWEYGKQYLEYIPFDYLKLRKAQYLDGRVNNLYFSKLKEQEIQKDMAKTCMLNVGVETREDPRTYELAWKRARAKIHAGEVYRENRRKLVYQLKIADRRKNSGNVFVLGERVFYAAKRMLRQSAMKK